MAQRWYVRPGHPGDSERGIYDRPWLSGLPNARETQRVSVPWSAHLGAKFCDRVWNLSFTLLALRKVLKHGLQSFHHVFFFMSFIFTMCFTMVSPCFFHHDFFWDFVVKYMTLAPESWARRQSMAAWHVLIDCIGAGHRASFVSVQRHTGYHWIRACFYSWKVCNSNKKFCSTN